MEGNTSSVLWVVWLRGILCIELVRVGFGLGRGKWGVWASSRFHPGLPPIFSCHPEGSLTCVFAAERGMVDPQAACLCVRWQPELDLKMQHLLVAVQFDGLSSEAGQAAISVSSLEPAPSSPWSVPDNPLACLHLCCTLVCVPVALDTHTPERWIVHCKLLSCLLWCMEQPTCLESSQFAFILADGKSRKPLRVGREAIFIHSVASTAKWWTELQS